MAYIYLCSVAGKHPLIYVNGSISSQLISTWVMADLGALTVLIFIILGANALTLRRLLEIIKIQI